MAGYSIHHHMAKRNLYLVYNHQRGRLILYLSQQLYYHQNQRLLQLIPLLQEKSLDCGILRIVQLCKLLT